MVQADASDFVGVPGDRADVDKPAPNLPSCLVPVVVSHAALGRDESGRPLVTEQAALLDEAGVTCRAERARLMELWAALTAEHQAHRRRQLDELRAQTKRDT